MVLIQVGQYLGHVAGGIDVRINPRDPALRVDQVGDPSRILRARIVGRAIGEPDRAIDVAEQVERKAKLFLEGAVFRRAVEADSDDDGVLGRKVLDSITEPFALDGSARGIGFRVPPEHHVVAAKLVERGRGAVLVRQRNRRRHIAHN